MKKKVNEIEAELQQLEGEFGALEQRRAFLLQEKERISTSHMSLEETGAKEFAELKEALARNTAQETRHEGSQQTSAVEVLELLKQRAGSDAEEVVSADGKTNESPFNQEELNALEEKLKSGSNYMFILGMLCSLCCIATLALVPEHLIEQGDILGAIKSVIFTVPMGLNIMTLWAAIRIMKGICRIRDRRDDLLSQSKQSKWKETLKSSLIQRVIQKGHGVQKKVN